MGFFSCFTIKLEPITPGVISKFLFYILEDFLYIILCVYARFDWVLESV